MIREVLPDVHRRLWVTTGDRTRQVELSPERGPGAMLPLRMPQVFGSVKVTDDGLALRWAGGFTVSLYDLTRPHPWLSVLTEVPARDRYRPLLPLLRYCTPGAALHEQPTRHHLVRIYALRAGELDAILRAYPVPEDRLLHRLHDIALCLHHHVFGGLPVTLLRRPWPYAAHRCPHDRQLHTLQSCFEWGRLDLVEDPLWALLRGGAAG